jgi:adenine-specific DNA methylase
MMWAFTDDETWCFCVITEVYDSRWELSSSVSIAWERELRLDIYFKASFTSKYITMCRQQEETCVWEPVSRSDSKMCVV